MMLQQSNSAINTLNRTIRIITISSLAFSLLSTTAQSSPFLFSSSREVVLPVASAFILPSSSKAAHIIFTTTAAKKDSCKKLSMSSDSAAGPTKKKFPPSRFVIDSDGKKWRLCVGIAVLNSSNRLLVGERSSVPDSWQCPQGGVDAAHDDKEDETIDDAAARELYEEMGLVVGKHVVPDEANNEDDDSTAVRYETTGTNSWLTKNGFTGQELHWRIYRCMDGRGDEDASLITDLSGQNGEPVEFTQVKWEDVNHVVENVWEAKKKNYEVLQSIINSSKEKWDKQCVLPDFEGRWSRQNNLGSNVMEGLLARGMDEEKAKSETTKPYIQTWNRDDEDKTAWIVSTFAVDGTTVRRKLKYAVGTWEEEYKGKSTLFGPSSSGGTVVTRRTFYVPEPDADKPSIAHITVSQTPKGIEESRRYLKDNGRQMILRRTFWSEGSGEPAVSIEVFTRD